MSENCFDLQHSMEYVDTSNGEEFWKCLECQIVCSRYLDCGQGG